MYDIEGLGTTFRVGQLGLLGRIEAPVEDVGVNSGEVGFTLLKLTRADGGKVGSGKVVRVVLNGRMDST